MQPEEITSEFYEALRRPNGWQSVRHFYTKINGVDKSVISEGLLATFQKRSFTAHEVGCAILWCLDIPFTRHLTSSLPELIVNWDVSIEELPWYLSDACGKENVDNAVEQIRGSAMTGSDTAKKLDTIQWWMSANPSTIREHRADWIERLTIG
jgi:hypothetical protein